MKETRFYHSKPEYLYEILNNPRVTICGIYDEEKEIMSFGISVCSTKDQFIKRIGREIAQNRAENKPYMKITSSKKDIGSTFIKFAIALEDKVVNMKKQLRLDGNL